MSSNKQNLSVVVWEWENKQGRWRPYSPEVTQLLERAYSKNFKFVMLGDAEPTLIDYYINLTNMVQTSSKQNISINIKRSLYPQSSPAGEGFVWKWAGDNLGDWHIYDMWVQCVLECGWAKGIQTMDMAETFPHCPYVINFCNMNQMNKKTGYRRNILRKTQAAYPIGRPATPHQRAALINQGASCSGTSSSDSLCSLSPSSGGKASGGARRKATREESDSDDHGAHKKSKNIISKMLHLASSDKNSTVSSPSPVAEGGCRPRPVPKPRTLFSCTDRDQLIPSANEQAALVDRQNQNDFDSKSSLGCSDLGGSLPCVARRPSVETISTYLSQESFTEDDQGNSDDSSQTGSEINLIDNKHHDIMRSFEKRLDRLKRDDYDSMSDDDVFSEDLEVQDVMCKAADTDKSKRPTNNGNGVQSNLNLISPKTHFVPIAKPVTESLNDHGAKRKRTNPPFKFYGNKSRDKHSNNNGCHGDKDPNYNINKSLTVANMANGVASSKLNEKKKKMPKVVNIRKPVNTKENLLLDHAKPSTPDDDADCAICMASLADDSDYDATASAGFLVDCVVSLRLCNHSFHEDCLVQMLIASPSSTFLQCPVCKQLYGQRIGTQPPGNLSFTCNSKSLPGHSGCGTIQIVYNIFPGLQGPEHPSPGRPYIPVGFPRQAYLPDNPKGRRVLKLLQTAFNRRLIFTVGTSVTSGQKDVVTWNEIHHKTSLSNYGGHGYPDPAYLDNVIQELADQGVIE